MNILDMGVHETLAFLLVALLILGLGGVTTVDTQQGSLMHSFHTRLLGVL